MEEEKKTKREVPNEELLSLVKSVNRLVGWDPFKEWANGLAALSVEMETHQSYFCFRNQAYLFSVNDGCGMTRVINLMTLIGKEIGAFSRDSYYEWILSNKSEGKRKSVSDVLEIVFNKENYEQMVYLDLSEFMDKSKHEELKSFLKELSHVSENYNFVFRIPYVELQSMNVMRDLISDIFLLQSFQIPPFTNEQLQEYVADDLSDYNLKMDPKSWPLFHARIREEKSDGKFYGLRTAQKVANEIVLRKHKYDGSLPDGTAHSNVIRPKEIKGIVAHANESQKTGFEELEELVGMDSVIARVKEIVAQLKISVANKSLERPSMHMRFLGAPGTGKTTVARIIGKIFAENGLLSNGYFFEYEARDLCGQYIGQTAPRTASICRDAYGSVLFIDEAYGLYVGERTEDYGIEAITTLLAEMENHRNDMVVIMAGYKEPMERLMTANVGLRSRMPFVIEFPSYSRETLTTIFMSMAKKHFECSDDLEGAVKSYFDELPDSYIQSEEFSNARFVRNLYERTWSKMAMRVQLNGEDEMTLKAEDFRTASREKEFSEKLTTGTRRVGY